MKTLTILMSTYNGEKFLDKQMQSIVSQKDVDDIKIRILVRDDGSTDGTIDILNKWKKRIDISIIKGENIGARNSFFVLLNSAPKSDYYAFCDQDDIWNYDKIAKSLNCIIKDKTLYFSNVEYIDKNDYSLKKNLLSKDFALSLERLFMCNPANGCTMVWDDGIQEVLKKVNNSSFTMHDEFVCMVAFVAGNVVYDEIPSMKYRIHGENVTQQRSLRKKYKLWKEIWFGRRSYSIDKRAHELQKHNIYPENIKKLKSIQEYKKGLNRIKLAHSYSCEDKRIQRSFRIRTLLGII